MECEASARARLLPGLFTFLHMAASSRLISLRPPPKPPPPHHHRPRLPLQIAVCCSAVIVKYRFCKAAHVVVFASGKSSPPPPQRRRDSGPLARQALILCPVSLFKNNDTSMFSVTHACPHDPLHLLAVQFLCLFNKSVFVGFFCWGCDSWLSAHHHFLSLFFFCVVSPQWLCSASTVSLPESLLFVSTLDGNLHAVSKKSGSIKWTLKEGKSGWGDGGGGRQRSSTGFTFAMAKREIPQVFSTP